MKTITFTITGEEGVVMLGTESFAKATGWEPLITIDGEEVENPVSMNEHCSNKLFEYIIETAKTYNVQKGAEWGRLQAIEHVESQLQTITHTLHS